MACLGVLCLGFAGCCGTATCRRDAPPGAVSHEPGANLCAERLADALLAKTGTVAQAICGTAKGNSFAADCVIKSDGRRLTVVFLAPHGRLATLSYTAAEGVKWRSESSSVPRSLSPAYVLFDLAAVNLKAATLRNALGNGFLVSEDGRMRRIAREGGERLAEVESLPSGDMRFTHLRYGYSYTIRNIDAAKP